MYQLVVVGDVVTENQDVGNRVGAAASLTGRLNRDPMENHVAD